MSDLWLLLLSFSKHVISFGSYFGVTLLIFYISKLLWKYYIIKTAHDGSSDLSHLSLPPGNFGLPFFGETLSWAAEGSAFNLLRRKKYGKVFSTHFLGRAMVKVTGAENVRQILQSEHDKVTTIWPTTIRKILGEHSIANTMGNEHKYIRKLAMKGFTHSALNSYISDARDIIAEKVPQWASGSRKIYDEILQMTFEISAKSMLGLKFETAEKKEKAFNTFNEMVKNLFSLPYDLPFSGFRKGYKCKEILHEMLHKHLVKKINRLQCNGNESEEIPQEENDVMQHILEADLQERRKKRSSSDSSDSDSEKSSDEDESCTFSIEQLKQNAIELLFAGFLTTGSSISSIIIQLAKHPEVREKLTKELAENGFLNETHTNIDLKKINKLSYLEQVLKETLRVMPPVLGGYRKALKTFQLGDYRIPKGWTIIYNIRDTHEYEFEDDTEFNPERFDRDNWSENRNNRFRWLPFGGGPRMCIGKEFARIMIKLTTIELLRNFESWSFKDDKEPPMFPVPALHPTNGLPMTFKPRHL